MKKVRRPKKPIKFRPELFWDVDPKTINPQKHAQYIIERVLDFGNDNEIRRVWQYYPKRLIFKTVSTSRGVLPATKSLWQELAKAK